jgi:hypothetical protein
MSQPMSSNQLTQIQSTDMEPVWVKAEYKSGEWQVKIDYIGTDQRNLQKCVDCYLNITTPTVE